MGEWSQDNIKNLARVLRCFQVASGLKVNFNKSRVFGIGVDEQEVLRGAAPLGCKPDSLPFTYLGVPVGANMKFKKHWKPVIDRFYAKLSPWKAKTLSFGGRLTLSKAVLGSLPSYFMSIFVSPTGVLESLEKIRRQFLWGGGDNKYKIPWVSWGKVVTSKEKGGLGLGSLRAFNLAMIVKWWWGLKNNKSTLWRRVITGIHNLHNKPAKTLAKKTIPGIWSNIAGVIQELQKDGLSFDDIFKKQVREGEDTLSGWSHGMVVNPLERASQNCIN